VALGEAAVLSGAIELDLRGLKCPLPAMKTERALARADKGARLRVVATDPMSVIDIPHAVAKAGATLVSLERDGRDIRFDIER
jgi:tRNA 2-thiouridine synthesizing protein A